MSEIEVKILAASAYIIEEFTSSIVTFEVLYPRIIHSEFMTHRMLSKNAASSRAIPTNKYVELVENDPVSPLSVGKNKPGMQASEELSEEDKKEFLKEWADTGAYVANKVKSLLKKFGVHKQTVNRMLEPWLPIRVVVTGTDWENFFLLRDSEYAQPEFQVLARKMREAMNSAEFKVLQKGDWHLPYITKEDIEYINENYEEDRVKETMCLLSAARCARVSHAIGGLSKKSIEEEIEKGLELYRVRHMSPFEHQATPWVIDERDFKLFGDELLYHLQTPDSLAPSWCDMRNLRGWRNLRSFIEHEEFKID